MRLRLKELSQSKREIELQQKSRPPYTTSYTTPRTTPRTTPHTTPNNLTTYL